MFRRGLPEAAELYWLGLRRPHAVTVYAPTEPGGREHAVGSIERQLRDALRRVRWTRAQKAAIRERWRSVAREPELTAGGGVALFLSPEVTMGFALPDRVSVETHTNEYFNVGQAVRAVSSPLTTYALVVTPEDWSLWWGTATSPAYEVPMSRVYLTHAGGPLGQVGRVIGRLRARDGARPRPLSKRQVERVAEAVEAELSRFDPLARRPLLVLGPGTLPEQLVARGLRWRAEAVQISAAPDARTVGAAIRSRAKLLAWRRLSERASLLRKEASDGYPSTDLAEIASAASVGRVLTFIYDCTSEVSGLLDEGTGVVRLGDGPDVLARVAVLVLRSGGEVLAVQPDEVSAETFSGVLAELTWTPPN
ncbi:MAG TPA: hypothetical protein PKV13_13410 [Propionicimonas sp.]|nr:hypothetical protein [Propionicimonas sp.]